MTQSSAWKLTSACTALLVCALSSAQASAETAPAASASAAAIPVRDFARFDEYEDAILSPTGEYLAVKLRIDNGSALGVIRTVDRTLATAVRLIDRQSIADIHWVSSDRLVYALAEKLSDAEQPNLTGELIGIEVNSRGSKYLFGFRGEVSTGSRINKANAENAYAEVVGRLRNEPNTVLIAAFPWKGTGELASGTLYRLNVSTGGKIRVGFAPKPGWTEFLADMNGFVRYAVGHYTSLMSIDTYARTETEKDWKQINIGDRQGANLQAISFSNERNTAYLLSDEQSDAACLIAHRLQDNQREPLACHPRATPRNYSLSHDGTTPIGIEFEPGKPELVVLDEHPDSKLMRQLAKSFAGYSVQITSWSDDGDKAVVHIYDDHNPGEFFLFDRKTLKADHLFSARSWLDPRMMGERRPLSFDSKDGMKIHAYLTLPKQHADSKLPLVVLPHGGPFYVRDGWKFDPEAQMLASRGYAVLQVNFRGSSGYGSAYINAGTNQWGTGMIDDIAAGTQHLIGQGLVDAQRICIYGASYGGYAALMSAVRYPELYRCAVGYAGVYDLARQKRDSDTARTKLGRSYLEFALGSDQATLEANSPIRHLDKLKAAVMIAHGEQDQRTPFSQAEDLRDALKARQYPFEWLSYPLEGHGFYRLENREAFYTKLLQFLDQHIGEKSAAKP